MRKKTSLVGDWSFMAAISAVPSTKPFSPMETPIVSGVTKELRGGGFDLASVSDALRELPVFVDEESLPFVLYISDQANQSAWRRPQRLFQSGGGFTYKFHFKWCKTLESMSGKNRFDRYRAKYDICNPSFEINDGEVRKNLKVCLNCCNEFQQVYGFFDARGKRIEEKFRMPEFFEEFGKVDLPLSSHPGGKDGYPRDWPKRAREAKETAGWRCQDCGRNCAGDKKNLHVHHISGVKSDSSPGNLEVVCRSCHANKPGHEHLRHQR